jgi:poly-gamma-glutamate capsule biosynthesis protein CapA/YwtB (metallophosphatase superfamily)
MPPFRIAAIVALAPALLAAGLFAAARAGSPEKAPTPLTQQRAAEKPVRLLFIGDMMFDRSVRLAAEAHGIDYLFSCASTTLRSYDAVVGNLEGPITDRASVSAGSAVGTPENFSFTFAPEVAPALFSYNIRIVNLGNNHILNRGVSGLHATRGYLDRAGVSYFGGVQGDSTVLRTTIKDRPFSFVSFNEFGGESAATTTELILKEKEEGRIVIVYAHWGDEYVAAPQRVKDWVHLFTVAGADAIIGSHPHVVQARGRHAGVPYFYSLGNFIFDQYWDESVRTGLAAELVFGSSSRIRMEEYAVTLMSDRRSCIEAATVPEE